MGFQEWKAAAGAALVDKYGIDPLQIAETVWQRLYMTNHAPRDAAGCAAAVYRNASASRRLAR
jgi:hypothetical protein